MVSDTCNAIWNNYICQRTATIKCVLHILYIAWDYGGGGEVGATPKCALHILYTICITHIRRCGEFGATAKCGGHIRYTAWYYIIRKITISISTSYISF